jgi:hypothetical protein
MVNFIPKFKIMKLKIILALLAVTLLASCSYTTKFTVISTKKVDLALGPRFKKGEKRVRGKDVTNIYFVFPDGVPTIEAAINNALENSRDSVALVDGVVYYHWWYIPYVFGKQTYEVEGTPLITKRYAFE